MKDVKSVDFYGIDFTHVKAVGVDEGPAQLKYAFNAINNLFIAEAKKYDVEKYFSIKEVTVNLDVVQKLNDNIAEATIKSSDSKYALTENDIASIINKYDLPKGAGVGLVFIANRLDKGMKIGLYSIVFFDKESRKILYSKQAIGQARGFGLRNYWAGSVYNIMNDYWSDFRGW